MTAATPASIDGLLLVNCTCERRIVTATPTQVRAGTPITCGGPGCNGTRPAHGTTRNPERPNMRGVSALGADRAPASCGTDAGYYRHIRTKGSPCTDCREAHARAESGRKRNRGHR
jgi:hypothetical protein